MFGSPKFNSSKQDLTAAALPATRRAVFFDVLRLQYTKLLLCGLVTLAATLPLMLTALMRDGAELSLYQQAQAGAISEQNAATYITLWHNLQALVEIPLLLLPAVALAGVGRVVKLLAWEEPVWLWPDLAQGVRQNARQMLALVTLAGMVRFVCVYAAGQGMWLPGVLAAVLLGPVAAYLYVCICVYSLPFAQQLRYALLLYARRPLRTLAGVFVGALVFVPQMLPNPYLHLAGRLVSGLLIPVVALGWFCFAFAQLDRVINPDRYPDLIGRGLHHPEAESGDKYANNLPKI